MGALQIRRATDGAISVYRVEMRAFIGIVIVVLYLIALTGIGVAIAMVYTAASGPDVPGRSVGVLGALFAGALPFLIGTVALGSAAIVTSLEESREDSRIAIETNVEAILARLDALNGAQEQ